MSDAFVHFRDLSPAGWQAWLSRRVVGREAPRWEDLDGWERMSISSVGWPYLPDRLHGRLAHLLYDRPYPPEPASVRRDPPLRPPDRQAVARRLAALGSADAFAARLGRARPGTPQWERLRRLVADEALPLYRWADAGFLDAVGSDPRLAAWLALRPGLDAAFGPELRLAGACLPGGRPPVRRATPQSRPQSSTARALIRMTVPGRGDVLEFACCRGRMLFAPGADGGGSGGVHGGARARQVLAARGGA